MNDKKITILLVEDDDIDAEAVIRNFKKKRINNNIVRACDGLEALDILRGEHENIKIEQPYLILLDINMPRMNGLEFLRTIRGDQKLKQSTVVILTTSENSKDQVTAKTLHAAAYLNKKDLSLLLQKIMKEINSYWITLTTAV